MKILHLITGLGKGGAESTLFQLLDNNKSLDFEYEVISLGASSYYEDEIVALGVPLTVLNIGNSPFQSFKIINNAVKNCDVLCCWMYHCNLIGYIAKTVSRSTCKVVWFIRHANLDKKYNKRRTLLINRICSKLSNRIDLIVFNGSKSKQIHESMGYGKGNTAVIQNGCDTEIYKYDKKARKSLVEELNISTNNKIVLSVSRDHPIKDLPCFIKAFSSLHHKYPETIAIVCGKGISVENKELVSDCFNNGLILNENIFLLGQREDIPRLMSACDLYVLHSAGEAFPNVLVQAMSCECICVSTDVGDVSKILGDNKRIVAPENPELLSECMEKALALSKTDASEEGKRNRENILKNYSASMIVEEYERLFTSI